MSSSSSSASASPAKRLFILLHAGLMWTVSKADASYCTNDQVTKCRNAAVDGSLDSLPAGGVCKQNKYVDYTHQCTVTDSITPWDYCCCAYQQKVFCCRYHYNHNYFRCNEAEDTIHVFTELPLAIEILIPAIVVPSVALLCFLFYCVKCCCCNEDDEEETGCCDVMTRCRRERRRRRKKTPPIRQDEPYGGSHDNQTSTLLPPASLKDSSSMSPPPANSTAKGHPPPGASASVSEKYHASLMDTLNFSPTGYLDLSRSRTQPTAPPYELNDDNPPPYNPGLYESAPPVVFTATTSGGGGNTSGLPYIHSKNEYGQEVIYQPVLASSTAAAATHIPLPVTRLSEHSQTGALSVPPPGGLDTRQHDEEIIKAAR